MNILPPDTDLIKTIHNLSYYSTIPDRDLYLNKFLTKSKISYSLNYLDKMWNNDFVNFTEKKQALHYLCRKYPNIPEDNSILTDLDNTFFILLDITLTLSCLVVLRLYHIPLC